MKQARQQTTRSIIQILAEMPMRRTTPIVGIWCSECEHEREERDSYGKTDIDQE